MPKVAQPSNISAPKPVAFSGEVEDRSLGDKKVAYEVLRYIPEESAEHYKLAPLAVEDGVLDVGMVDPDNLGGIDALNFIARSTGVPFKIFRISEADFQRVLDMYRGLGGEVDRAVSDLETEQKERPVLEDDALAPLDLDDPSIGRAQVGEGGVGPAGIGEQHIREDAPAIKIFSTILRYAIDGRASDVHIEPLAAGVRVRYRVDGELHTSVILPESTQRALIARVKVLASIRLDEQRKPQDGRFSATIDGRPVDFRVSTFPSYHGEKVVIRILDRDKGFISLEDIGLTERNLKIMRHAISQPHGLILISGPTGSGKSTTIHAMLSAIDREHKNVLSIEDPIEYFVEGVTQSQVRPEIGYTFASGLRTTLRQDPDVIMVGEIRDAETAKLAFQAALTGHLVLSTIHTNDAVGTVTRLIDMGVEPYLIPPVLILSMAQRLVRTFCAGGGKEVELSASARKRMEMSLKTLPEKYRFEIPKNVYEPTRTPTCPTGLSGRMAVFEMLEMSPKIERLILDNHYQSDLWAVARAEGMLTMHEDAMLKASQNLIPFSELDSLGTQLILGDEELKEEKEKKAPTEKTPEEKA